MRHQNSVFWDVLKQVPWGEFERLVAAHGADAAQRGLTSRDQLIAMLYGQLSGAASLREIEAGLHSHASQLYHLGGGQVCRSTLADANRHRPAAVFTGLFAALVARFQRSERRRVGEAVRLIASTSVRLSGLSERWARFSAGVCGAKAHVIFDPDADLPLYAAVSSAKRNDISAAQEMPIEPGATYVFDLGYYDFGWWAKLDAAGCRIVTRLKANTRFTVAEVCPAAVHRTSPPAPVGSPVRGDRIGHLPQRLAASRRNPMARLVREIEIEIETGKRLRLFTNDLEASAETIAELYKRRWAIELFFRWVKQTLEIGHFFGVSENAVRLQIAVALIAFVLLRLAHQASNLAATPLAFARLIRINLMHRRAISTLLPPRCPARPDTRQGEFPFTARQPRPRPRPPLLLAA